MDGFLGLTFSTLFRGEIAEEKLSTVIWMNFYTRPHFSSFTQFSHSRCNLRDFTYVVSRWNSYNHFPCKLSEELIREIGRFQYITFIFIRLLISSDFHGYGIDGLDVSFFPVYQLMQWSPLV